MPIVIDLERGKKVAKLLYNSFTTTDIHGRTGMPRDMVPSSVAKGSLGHILFITLTISINYKRDASSLWESSIKTFDDPETKYLFDPKLLHETPLEKIVEDMHRYNLSPRPEKDADIWQRVGVTFYEKWSSDPRNFFKNSNWDSSLIVKRLRTDTHTEKGETAPDYPYLRSPKIRPLWLKMLRDDAGMVELRNLEAIPILVDAHVARATLATGVIRGQFKGTLDELSEDIREAWFQSVEGLNANERPMIAIDMYQPLSHLSMHGCSNRDEIIGNCTAFNNCEARDLCIKGKIKIDKNFVDLET